MTKTATKTIADLNPKKAVPVLLSCFVFSLIIDNGFKFISKPIADDLHLSATAVSLQATLVGIIIGIGAVLYAALADSFSIRLLMSIGIGLIIVGSLLGFIFHTIWTMVLIGRIIQTTGLAAAETLYVIYVTKFLRREDQKTYLGFSTAAFQTALLFGTLAGGYITTWVSWTWMFVIPLVLIVALPFLFKKVPVSEATTSSVDILGLFIVAVISTSIIMYMQKFHAYWLIPVAVGIGAFAWHISAHKGALVRPEFFTNGRYVWALVLVAFVYSVQLAYLFLIPYALNDLYGYSIEQSSLTIAPGYFCAAIVGTLSGVIAKVLNSRPAIVMSLVGIVGALVLGAVFLEQSVVWVSISIVIFACSFALMYAPLLATAIRTIPRAKSGIAIGFYNLTINIAVPVGIAYTAKLIDLHPMVFKHFTLATSEAGGSNATILWIIAVIGAVGAVIYLIADAMMARKEAKHPELLAAVD